MANEQGHVLSGIGSTSETNFVKVNQDYSADEKRKDMREYGKQKDDEDISEQSNETFLS